MWCVMTAQQCLYIDWLQVWSESTVWFWAWIKWVCFDGRLRGFVNAVWTSASVFAVLTKGWNASRKCVLAIMKNHSGPKKETVRENLNATWIFYNFPQHSCFLPQHDQLFKTNAEYFHFGNMAAPSGVMGCCHVANVLFWWIATCLG